MVSCDLCGKTFKNKSGLTGHKRLKHYLGSTNEELTERVTEQLPQEKSLLERLLEPSTEDKHHDQEQPNQLQEQLIEQQTALIEQLQGQLASTEEHEHSAASCHQCHHFAYNIWEEGRNAGLTEALEIPGVDEAAQFSKEQAQRNNEHPNDTPVVTNWVEVPGVSELVFKYQQHNAFITITR